MRSLTRSPPSVALLLLLLLLLLELKLYASLMHAHAECARLACRDGAVDPFSLHGGCPVTSGVKWAVNQRLWTKPWRPITY